MQLVEGQEVYLRAVSAAGKAKVDVFRPDPHDASVSKREWTRQCSRWRKAMRCIIGFQFSPPVPNHTDWEDCGASFSMRAADVNSSAEQPASSEQAIASAINFSVAQHQKRIKYVQLVEGQERYLRAVSAAGIAVVDKFRPDQHDASLPKREWERQCSRWQKALRCLISFQIPPPVPNHTEWERAFIRCQRALRRMIASAERPASIGSVQGNCSWH